MHHHLVQLAFQRCSVWTNAARLVAVQPLLPLAPLRAIHDAYFTRFLDLLDVRDVRELLDVLPDFVNRVMPGCLRRLRPDYAWVLYIDRNTGRVRVEYHHEVDERGHMPYPVGREAERTGMLAEAARAPFAQTRSNPHGSYDEDELARDLVAEVYLGQGVGTRWQGVL